MHQSNSEAETIARFADAVDRMNRNLDSWSPFFQRLTQAETMRFLALGQSTDINSAAVRSIIGARRLRDRHFWPSMSEAPWAMMLEMYARVLSGERQDLAELSEAAGIAVEEARRWAGSLAERGMVFREAEGTGSESIRLTDEGADRMRAYLLEALELSPWVV